MSGTSLDGLDVAITRFEGQLERPDETEIVHFASTPYDPDFRAGLAEAIDTGTPDDLCRLDAAIGLRTGVAVEEALAEAGVPSGDVIAIGSHGQTMWHRPPEGSRHGSTLQIGSPAVIAETCGIDVVSDFRSRDMAAGGHGAPLTAHTDWLMFVGSEARLIQNIGGIANVTVLPADGGREGALAFDTGPGCGLIDGAVRALFPHQAFDRDGRIAASGTTHPAALEEWLADPFFRESPPRSTGRELFSMPRLSAWLERHSLPPEDAVATLTELTARTIADAYRFVPEGAPVFLGGGGASNPTLAARLRELVAPREVKRLSELGVDPDAREAVAFALLARQHVLGFPANAPWATGAAGRRILGSMTPA